MLAPMKYRDFTWPNNPTTYEVELRRTLHSYKLPLSGFTVQNLGVQHRVFKGEGEFTGPDAYESFRRLAKSFSYTGAGWLEHPVWPPVKAYFAKLSLKEEPRDEYVRYAFEFWECEDQTGYTAGSLDPNKSKYVSAEYNDTLALIAARYSKEPEELLALNPQIASTDVLDKGRLVRIS